MTLNPSDAEIARVEAWQKAQREDEITRRVAENQRRKQEAEDRVRSALVGKTVESVEFPGDGLDWAQTKSGEGYHFKIRFTDNRHFEVRSPEYHDDGRAFWLGYTELTPSPTGEPSND